jgi:hypothetical protein
MFRHQVKAPSSKEAVLRDLVNYPKWTLDPNSIIISGSYAQKEKLMTDPAYKAEIAKYYMAFQSNGKCQLYMEGKTLNGTYRIEAVKDAFGKGTTPMNEMEKKRQEQIDKISDKSVQHVTGSNDYFLYISVPGSPEGKFEIQILVGDKMVLYIDQVDQVSQWKGERPKK